jgi:hypothetical protein
MEASVIRIFCIQFTKLVTYGFLWQKKYEKQIDKQREERGTQNSKMRFLWKLNIRCRRLNKKKCVFLLGL